MPAPAMPHTDCVPHTLSSPTQSWCLVCGGCPVSIHPMQEPPVPSPALPHAQAQQPPVPARCLPSRCQRPANTRHQPQ